MVEVLTVLGVVVSLNLVIVLLRGVVSHERDPILSLAVRLIPWAHREELSVEWSDFLDEVGDSRPLTRLRLSVGFVVAAIRIRFGHAGLSSDTQATPDAQRLAALRQASAGLSAATLALAGAIAGVAIAGRTNSSWLSLMSIVSTLAGLLISLWGRSTVRGSEEAHAAAESTSAAYEAFEEAVQEMRTDPSGRS